MSYEPSQRVVCVCVCAIQLFQTYISFSCYVMVPESNWLCDEPVTSNRAFRNCLECRIDMHMAATNRSLASLQHCFVSLSMHISAGSACTYQLALHAHIIWLRKGFLAGLPHIAEGCNTRLVVELSTLCHLSECVNTCRPPQQQRHICNASNAFADACS